MAKKAYVKRIGIDISTTAFSAGAITTEGEEIFFSTPMKGATTWHGEPAFDLNELPKMFEEVLFQLETAGDKGTISWSVRQHDMVLVGHSGEVLIPAISWESGAATEEVAHLQAIGAESLVGKIAPRFILPKLMWVFSQDPNLRDKIRWVMTTGDYFDWILRGGTPRLSTSDALSNSLLLQSDKTLASELIEQAGLDPAWFPDPIQSGQVTGSVSGDDDFPEWGLIKYILEGWDTVAGLGDNHATAVGCGMSDSDMETIVVSIGTSGTVNRLCVPGAAVRGEANQFEYYENRLLLMMEGDSGSRWERYKKQFAPDKEDQELDQLAWDKYINGEFMQRVPSGAGLEGKPYLDGFENMSMAQQVASVQASIAMDIGHLVDAMVVEIEDETPVIERLVLTGGLVRSKLVKEIFINAFPDFDMYVSSRQGPLAYQTATFVALINAMVGVDDYDNLDSAIEALCPLKQIK